MRGGEEHRPQTPLGETRVTGNGFSQLEKQGMKYRGGGDPLTWPCWKRCVSDAPPSWPPHFTLSSPAPTLLFLHSYPLLPLDLFHHLFQLLSPSLSSISLLSCDPLPLVFNSLLPPSSTSSCLQSSLLSSSPSCHPYSHLILSPYRLPLPLLFPSSSLLFPGFLLNTLTPKAVVDNEESIKGLETTQKVPIIKGLCYGI